MKMQTPMNDEKKSSLLRERMNDFDFDIDEDPKDSGNSKYRKDGGLPIQSDLQ